MWFLCFQERSDATVMLLTVWQQVTCVSLSLVPASPDFSILRTPILHSPTAAWTHLQARQTSAEPNRPKTTLALPCPLWNAVTKTCAIPEDCMKSSLLPRAKPQDKETSISMTAAENSSLGCRSWLPSKNCGLAQLWSLADWSCAAALLFCWPCECFKVRTRDCRIGGSRCCPVCTTAFTAVAFLDLRYKA